MTFKTLFVNFVILLMTDRGLSRRLSHHETFETQTSDEHQGSDFHDAAQCLKDKDCSIKGYRCVNDRCCLISITLIHEGIEVTTLQPENEDSTKGSVAGLPKSKHSRPLKTPESPRLPGQQEKIFSFPSPSLPLPPRLPRDESYSSGWKNFSLTERYIFIGVFSVVLFCGLIACCRCLSICIDPPSRRRRLTSVIITETGNQRRITTNTSVQRPDFLRIPGSPEASTHNILDSPPPYEEPPDYNLSLSLSQENKITQKVIESTSRDVRDDKKTVEAQNKRQE